LACQLKRKYLIIKLRFKRRLAMNDHQQYPFSCLLAIIAFSTSFTRKVARGPMIRALTLSRLVAIVSFAAVFYNPSPGLAVPILGSELASFAVLGAETVTNTGATTLIGNLGVSPGTSITGSGTITLTGELHQTDSFASTAQTQLGGPTGALTTLGSLGVGTPLLLADLSGLTLIPGIYSVPEGTTNLTGTLTLDGTGFLPADQFWVFQMQTTLITDSNSKVDVINTSTGAGVFWNVPISATLGTGTSFEGFSRSRASH
jgi:type VI secretion system secreted protein VgrG